MIESIGTIFGVAVVVYLTMAAVTGYLYSTRVEPDEPFELILGWPVALVIIVCVPFIALEMRKTMRELDEEVEEQRSERDIDE